MGLTRKEWSAFLLTAIVAVGLTVLVNVVDVNGQLATVIVLVVAGLGSGWVANVEARPVRRPRSQ